MLVVAGALGLVWQVVDILTSMSCCAAAVEHRLQRRMVAMTFSGFTTSASPIVASATLGGSFRGLDELCPLASRLGRIVAITDDL